ncbi:MAG: succinylglutamate-semialdehyde dehydrogenase [Pseudomonadales bacterium]|nr:succinylglutamate-semialdehyde dehydrogenase [Pseudomonadales bacterium]
MEQLYINGRWAHGQGYELNSLNPSTGVSIWRGQSAGEEDVDRAVMSARSVFPDWRAWPLQKRIDAVEAFALALEHNKEQIAFMIAQETSKPLWESRTEVQSMIGKVNISISAQAQRAGETRQSGPAGDAVLRHRPHGVLAVYGPYNFPGHLPNGHIVPALLAGNCVVFKPSEQTPAVADLVVQCWEQAGLPAGVLNLVQGAADVGRQLAAHPQIDGILFTGSSGTGHALHQQFAGAPEKILALEMGGNNPLIVHDYESLDAAVYLTLFSAFVSAGQRCTCARRLFVPRTAQGDDFVAGLISAAARIEPGQYDASPQPFIGGVIHQGAKSALLAAQDNLLALGGGALLAMRAHSSGLTHLTPGIIDVTALAEPPDEEWFGPLLSVSRYDSVEDAITQANRTRFGLAAGLVSRDHQLYQFFLERIRAGIVNWNKPLTGASSAAPFGGVGQSGNHRPSAFYAADYCAYPMASMEAEQIDLPESLAPGISL